MNSILVYDSLYGNTEKIALSIENELIKQGDTNMVRVGNFTIDMLSGSELLVVGSPTQQLRPSAAIRDFLERIPSGRLIGMHVAAFDTRLTQKKIKSPPVLPFFVKIFGYAAEPIAKTLQKKGGHLVIPPVGFYVEDMQGPLVEGELERAATWAKKLYG
jgi:flavodoxin